MKITKKLTEKEIIEGSKKICEFVGIKPIKGCNEYNKEYYYYNDPILKDFVSIPEYATDFNELIPIVRKCHDVCPIFTIDELDDESYFIPYFMRMDLLMPIELIFKYTVMFIDWYNKQPKKN